MKSGLITFSAGTILLLFAFFGRSTERYFPPTTLDDKIKITSISNSTPIANREPIVLPFMGTIKSAQKISIKKVQPPAPEIKASSALVLDLTDKEVILELKSERRWPIASITKLMTSVLAAETVGFQKQITLNAEDILTEGSAGDFKEGEIYTVGDLVKAMLVVSSNDAADAVARFYGHRLLVDAMQEKARELELLETTFADSSGLSSLNQSTARDIEKLAEYILSHHPDFLNLTAQKEVIISELGSNIQKKLLNINKFAGRKDFWGGKTGYIDEAGGNLVSLFKYGSHTLLIIVFGTEDRFLETEKLYDWAKTML